MSYQAVQWALDRAPMLRTDKGKPDATARAVLVARAERADEHGRDSHAAIADVIWRTGYDERTVQRAEERLEAAGLLVRDGVTRFGTIRWNLDMTKVRDESERAEIEAAIAKRKADNAARERARRERQRAARTAADDNHRVDSPSTRVHGNSTRVDSPSTRVDFDSTRVDGTPPEPPTNRPGTTRETTQEPSSGGTLPPDPLRPQSPTAPGNGIESSLSDDGQQPPQPETATHDRARETEPAGPPNLRLVVDNAAPGKGFGFCLACHAEGHTTLAVDPVSGDACLSHIRSAG
ncbi:hypothetical protein ACFFMR_18990 [Micromonospora andamanensis]|uniref:Helix-turn-helix domain-containing protein n=1 Tax=Micromonospora andamanensis TaxID=1287068 RepID=A0ABQ4HYN5_9ACTN|nr:hypothetical protein [Micromonospora andamanensis]GIJ10754.1 hypothetical protein Van01_39680 [Micromonospora andamanensis]